MSNNLFFDFVVNKEARTVTIVRDFAAELSLVWDAYTRPELLDQWWAPQPFTSRTRVMDFVVGGRRIYAMVSPEGEERWAVQQYTSISPKTHFALYNAFADKDGNPEAQGSAWDFHFSEHEGLTRVSITIYNESQERMERILAMGFKEGMLMTMRNLEALLEQQSRA